MKKNLIILTIMVFTLAASVAMAKTSAVTIEGSFNGALCAFYEKQCPAELTDAHIAIERDFLLRDAKGKDYVVVNLPRSTKVRHLNEKIKISGKINDRGSIFADRLDIYKNDGFVTVWNLKDQLAEREHELRSR
jgi:hypothetical protein